MGWRWLGYNVLDKGQTSALLVRDLVAESPADQIRLPTINDFVDSSKRIFDSTEASVEPGFVWRHEAGTKRAVLLRCGALLSNGNVLCTDWLGNRRLIEDIINLRSRLIHEVDTLIAPWSHHLDGIRFGGYYDYVVLIAAKLCRMKEAVGGDVFDQAAIAYPLFGTSYERELLALLGFTPDRIFDSRLTNVRFKTCILGNSGHWFYPNGSDLLALKRHLAGKIPAVSDALADYPANRVYISRSGRRRIQNEEALIALLEKYNIKTIADEPRTIAEQMAIYQNASFIIGPHGASFTNILWCRPGAHLVELFSPNYIPDFFLYMAQRLGLHYSAYYHGPPSKNSFSGLDEDIVVSIPDLERRLDEFFSVKTLA